MTETMNITEALWIVICLSGLPLPAIIALDKTHRIALLEIARRDAIGRLRQQYEIRIGSLTVLRYLCLGVIGILVIFVATGLFAATMPPPSPDRPTTTVGWAIAVMLLAGVIFLNGIVVLAFLRDRRAQHAWDTYIREYVAESPSGGT